MRTTRSIALTLALAAAPLTAVAPAHAQNTPSNEAPASGTVTTQAEPSNGKPSSGTVTTQAEESTSTSTSTSTSEEKDEDKGFPWGLLGLLGLAGLLGMGGRKREETEVRHTTTPPRQTETYRPEARTDDVRVVDSHDTTTTRADATSRTDGLTQRADDRFGDGDGRLDRDDLPGTGRR